MFNTNKSLYDRQLEKTPEQVFVNSLRKEYELSPAESLGILELAKSCLFGEVPSVLGKQKFLCASKDAKHGRKLKEQEMVKVGLNYLINSLPPPSVPANLRMYALRSVNLV